MYSCNKNVPGSMESDGGSGIEFIHLMTSKNTSRDEAGRGKGWIICLVLV